MSSTWPRSLLAIFVFAIVTLVLLRASGAFSAEFGASADEAAHFVTALLVSDYLRASKPGPPVPFAENYYLHYPQVAFGIWPPLFHLTAGLWMWLFSASRVTILLLMALWTVLIAATTYAVVKKRFGYWAGVGAGVLLISLPPIQSATSMVMADTLVALLCCWSAICFGRFVETEDWRDAAAFGVFSSLAILTKYNALALALVPILTVAFTRRFDLLRRWTFWLPLGIVLILCGPWYFMQRHLVEYATEPWPSLALARHAALVNFLLVMKSVGVPAFLLATTGFVVRVVLPWRRRAVAGVWASAAALALSPWIFHSLLYPASEVRYLLVALPPLILFLAAGVDWAASSLAARGWPGGLARAVCVLAVAILYALQSFSIPVKPHHHFGELAEFLEQPEYRDETVLISSEGTGEGSLVSEIALHEARPGRIVLRARKVLSNQTWMGEDYRPLYRTPEQILGVLDECAVSFVVIDLDPGFDKRPHHQQLIAAVASQPNVWRPTMPIDGLLVYQRVGATPRSTGKIRIDMSYTLGKSLEN